MLTVILDCLITHVMPFDDGNHSYTVKAIGSDTLYRFVEATALTDGKRPLLRTSHIQVELAPIVDAEGTPVIRTPQRKDGTLFDVHLGALKAWYLVEAAKSADEKRSAKPLVV